jgi:hypothetical protein
MKPMKSSLLLSALLLPSLLVAEEAYRSLDETGQAIFSDTPPADGQAVEKIELMPGPSPQSVRDAEARHEAVSSQLEKLQKERERKEQIRAARVQEAEKALEIAEAELADAKQLKDSDRQSLATGKRKIKPEYFERVKEAELAVEAARKELQKARGF